MADIYVAKTQATLYEEMERYLIGQTSALRTFTKGSRTRTILEAVSIVAAEAQFDFWKAMRAAIPVAAIEGFGFARKAGVTAIGKLTFLRNTVAPVNYPIPSGTRVVLGEWEYQTTVNGQINIGNTSSGEIVAEAVVAGESNISIAAIDTQNGFGSILAAPLGIQFARNDTAFTGGTTEETNDERMERFRLFLQNLARSVDNGILAGALSVDGVRSASIRNSYPSAGWVTVYCDDGTGGLDPAIAAEVYKVLNGDTNDPTNYWGYRASGIHVRVDSPTIANQTINVTIFVPATAVSTDASLISAVKSALEVYVNGLKMGNDVIFSELVRSVQDAADDIYDATFAAPVANVSISANQIARTSSGLITVTVTRGSYPL